MPRALRDISDARAKRKRERARRRARKAGRRSSRRRFVGKAIAVAAVLLVLLVLALSVGDSSYHATVIGWTPFVAAVVIIVLSYVYLRVLVASIELFEDPKLRDCQRGLKVPYTVHFRNKSPLVFFRVRAYFFVSDLFGNVANEVVTTLALGPFQTYDMTLDVTFEHIGTYTAGLERVVVSDFLGLFTRSVARGEHHEVNVTPQIQVLEQVTFDDVATVETSKAAKSIIADSMDYAQVREYVPGDPLKAIHWKLSSRLEDGSYLTRLYEVYTDPGVAVIMDFYADNDEARVLMGMFDAVVEAAFSVATFTQEKGMDTEVVYRNKYGEDRSVLSWNENTLPDIIEDTPRMTNDERDARIATELLAGQVMARDGKSTLVVCSASMDPELIAGLVDAKARRRSPLLISVIPPDIDGRARDAYCKPLAKLDAANIPYVVITRSEELAVTLA